MFGENFPAATDPPAEQVFSLLTAATGLAAFALILALVEQVRSAPPISQESPQSARETPTKTNLASATVRLAFYPTVQLTPD